MQRNKNIKRIVCISIFVCLVVLLALYELLLKNVLFGGIGEWEKGMTDMLITRLLGGGAFLVFTVYLGYRVLDPITRPVGKNFLLFLPALVIAINNMPIIPLISGHSRINAKFGSIILLLFECLAIGFFEEMAFRSVVMLGIMERRHKSKKDIVVAILLSAAIFGLVHAINLFISPSASVVLQIMYSALIGAMCSVVLLLTRNIWACVLIHGLFNFFGAIVSECGEGRVFFTDTPTQIVTAIIAVIVIAIYIWLFIKFDVSRVSCFYRKEKADDKQAINQCENSGGKA